MEYFPYEFEAEICRHDVGTYCYTVVYLPPEVQARLPAQKSPRYRVEAELGELPFEGAWQPSKGRHYLMLSPRLLRQAGCGLGDRVELRFRLIDPERVTLPPELEACLRENPQVAGAWALLSAGKKRALAYRLDSARQSRTRAARLAEIVQALTGGDAGPLARVLGGRQQSHRSEAE